MLLQGRLGDVGARRVHLEGEDAHVLAVAAPRRRRRAAIRRRGRGRRGILALVSAEGGVALQRRGGEGPGDGARDGVACHWRACEVRGENCNGGVRGAI